MQLTILDKIVAAKRQEIEASREKTPLRELQAALADAPSPRDFGAALAAPDLEQKGPIRMIAEVKKASPSAGLIRADFDPVAIARTYEEHGAACISVLTDKPFFQGDLAYLVAVRSAVGIPVLRKDFILDSYQLVEARAAGADAVLLIAECLDVTMLHRLHDEALELGLTPLVELYEPNNLDRVLGVGATVVGINNRNLRTFDVDLHHTIRLRQRVPDRCILVGESGIRTREDVILLESAGVDAILVGERLMREPDIGLAVDTLHGRSV